MMSTFEASPDSLILEHTSSSIQINIESVGGNAYLLWAERRTDLYKHIYKKFIDEFFINEKSKTVRFSEPAGSLTALVSDPRSEFFRSISQCVFSKSSSLNLKKKK